VGEDIRVTPVLALPGWWIKFDAYPKIGKIYNGNLENDKGQFDISKMKKSFFITGNKGDTPLWASYWAKIKSNLNRNNVNLQFCLNG
jgi:hypothetical protein